MIHMLLNLHKNKKNNWMDEKIFYLSSVKVYCVPRFSLYIVQLKVDM